MKTKRNISCKVLLLFTIFALLLSCEKEEEIKIETNGVIRNEEDARLVAIDLNNILEDIRDDLDYGYTYTNYSPDGTYTVNGSAYSGPIFSGAYTYEYIKKFTVSFNNYTYQNRTTIESGTISYSFTDYSSSGYHLIIDIRSTSEISIKSETESYTIEDKITNLVMADRDDNQYMIGGSFKNSNGTTYSVKAY
ncbi:MAG: hypothetical protein PF485_03710 [Bacteroidales bacterium]|jgi:hypothetical protein|nr:hypothetical protein [Bacteroidales bacterium]